MNSLTPLLHNPAASFKAEDDFEALNELMKYLIR